MSGVRLALIGNIAKRSKFSNRTVKHSNRTVIACNRENVSVYPQEANMFCCKYKVHNILNSCCPLNTNHYNSEDQSETMHNILFAYKTTKVLDNKMCIASEGL